MKMQDFVKEFATKQSMTQAKAREVIESVLDGIFDATVSEGSFRTPKGTFALKTVAARPARKGRNPATGEEIDIPATPEKKKVTFSMSKPFKEELNS